jgi:hypothetical protein
MRRILLLLVPGLAAADPRIDLAPMPELVLLETAYHLDRGTDWESRTKRGIIASVGVGYTDGSVVDDTTIAAGIRTRRYFAAASSELLVESKDFVRGRHQALLRLHSDGKRGKLGGVAQVGAAFEHGDARALAPIAIGPGRRYHGSAFADELIALEEDDLILGFLVGVDGDATRWLDAPLLDNAYHGALSMGVAATPEEDDELPGGRIDAIVARVEHGRILRKLAAAGSASIAEVKTRTIDLMSGVHELTGWIDHEALFAVTVRFGAKWIEAESNGRTLKDTMFAMQLGAHFKWGKRQDLRELGIMVSRNPTPSADGQSILSETRLEIVGGAETEYAVVTARGGLAWIVPQQVQGDVHTLKNYAIALEGFAKLGHDIELGGYYTASYEPQIAGDPWASPPETASEVGALMRWRPRLY